jgi:hypothetical protein
MEDPIPGQALLSNRRDNELFPVLVEKVIHIFVASFSGG